MLVMVTLCYINVRINKTADCQLFMFSLELTKCYQPWKSERYNIVFFLWKVEFKKIR